MTRQLLLRAVAVHRARAAQRGQSGFVLGVVLAAMTVGLLLITALLSLSFATHRAAIAQQEAAREQRAADGALETGVTRTRAGFNASTTTDPCAFVGASNEVDTIDFDWDTASTNDDVSMELHCDEVVGNQQVSAGTVRIVGDEYTHGTLPGAYDWQSWPWADVLGAEAPPDSSLSPTLVHKGGEPLLFNGGVAVRKGAAGFIDTADPLEEAGAVAVAGDYLQGDTGHLGTAAEQCGMLELGNTELDGSVALDRTSVVDADADPDCVETKDGDPISDSIVPTEVDPVPTGTAQTVGGCAGGTVQTFQPGIYDSTATQALNALFDGSSCTGKVFHFAPGDYWFNAGGSEKTLEFADQSSAFVFGTLEASGSPTTATCTRDVAGGGVKVVLAGRSTLRHTGGNVSICGNPGAAHTLVQSKAVPPGITLDPSTVASGTHCNSAGCSELDFENVGNVLAAPSGGNDATADVDCQPESSRCDLEFSVQLEADGTDQIDDLRLMWTSSEVPPAHGSNNRRVRVILADNSGTVICDEDIRAGRTPGFISDVDLSGCAGGLTEADLDGANLLVRFSYLAGTYSSTIGEMIVLSVRGLEMLVNASEVDASDATGDWSQWRDNSNVPGVLPGVLAPGGAWARPMVGDCGSSAGLPNEFCRYTVAEIQPQVINLTDFQFTGAGFEPEDEIDRLLLAVDNRNGDSLVAAPNGNDHRGRTSVTISLEDGFTCTVGMQDYNTFTRSENTYYIDLARSPCDSLVSQQASALDGADIEFSMTPERGIWIGNVPFWDLGLKLPFVDHVRLTATTRSENDFSRALVTIDTANNNNFRVHGNVVLPRTSLNIHWTGDVDVEPIVHGNMEVDSLGSSADAGASVGIVCCGDGQRESRIIAAIEDPSTPVEDRIRGIARASYTRTDGDLADATVTGWQFCGGGGCVLPPTSSLASPP